MQSLGTFVGGPGGEFILFAGLAALTLFSALAVVMARRVTHACLSLLPCFIGIAGLYAMLSAPVMVAMQILIYAGGITVLLLFAIFLLERRVGPVTSSNHYVVPSMLIAGLMGVVLLAAIRQADFHDRSFRPPPVELQRGTGPQAEAAWYAYERGERRDSNLQRTGFYFLTYYLLPFELSSLILVIAMVGAILIARRERTWVAAGVERPEAHPDVIPESEERA